MKITEKQLRELVAEAMAELPAEDYRVKAKAIATELVGTIDWRLLDDLRTAIEEQPSEYWQDVPPAVFDLALTRAFDKLRKEMYEEFWKLTKGGTPKPLNK